MRTTEDMLLLVPDALREAAASLGLPRSLMIMRIAYRAARAGILTGMLLAIARISGETAPLLFTALNNQFWSTNLNAPMASLPAVIFQFALSPYADWQKLAWTGALLITVTVLALNIIARALAATEKTVMNMRIRHQSPPSRTRPRHRRPCRTRSRSATSISSTASTRAEEHHPVALREQGDGVHRPFRLRQVHAAARAQPHVRPLSGPARGGQVLLDGEDILAPKQDLNLLRARVGMVFQKPTPFPMSIYENIAFGIRLYERLPQVRARRPRRARAAPRRAVGGGEGQAQRQRPEPSGGQQQRLCIARTVAVKPEVILFDEPCSALDPISTAKIEELIDELKKDYTIVIVTHNMQQAARVSDYTAFMYLGELIEFGSTSRSSRRRTTSAPRTTSPAASAEDRDHG